MSGMPAPAPAPAFSGASATIASVVRMFFAIDAAFCSAERVTIVGSMMPLLTRSSTSPESTFRPWPGFAERTGAHIVRRALEEPLRQIAENAGLEGSVVVNDVRHAKKGHGLNAANGEIVDLVSAGIIDPAMVTRSALQNAASIAKNILTTEAVVAEAPEKQQPAPMGGGMPDMM